MSSAATSPAAAGDCAVSVIVPAYNARATLAEAVRSALDQGIPGLEVLVVDDGSTDGTPAILVGFAASPAVRVLQHPGGANRGVCASRRLAIAAARGEFLAFLDADDVYLPGKLARHLAILRTRPDVALVHGRVHAIGVAAPGADGPAEWFTMGDRELEYDLTASAAFLQSSQLCNSTVVCRRSAVLADDLPEEMLFQLEDWLLFSLVALRGRFFYDPEPLTRYRYHEGSFSYRHYRRTGGWELAHVEYLLAMMARLPELTHRRRAADLLVDNLVKLARLRAPAAAAPPSPSPTEHPATGRILRSLTRATLARFAHWQLKFSAPRRFLVRGKSRVRQLFRRDEPSR